MTSQSATGKATLKVKEYDDGNLLVWGDAMGSRIYRLTSKGATTNFSMTEKISGPLFPLFRENDPAI